MYTIIALVGELHRILYINEYIRVSEVYLHIFVRCQMNLEKFKEISCHIFKTSATHSPPKIVGACDFFLIQLYDFVGPTNLVLLNFVLKLIFLNSVIYLLIIQVVKVL